MISEETNCAPKVARNRFSLRSSKRAVISSRRPKTVTSACPVYASSTSEFTTPVASHCWANSFCARLPTTPVSTSATGITASAMRESCHEMVSIISSTPHTVRIEFTSPVTVFIRVFWMLSMSLVTRERISPRFIRSK